MSASPLRGYRFSTDAQWNTCRFVQADHDAIRTSRSVQPFAPYARPGTVYGSGGAHAPVVTHAGDILWRDDKGCLYRLTACDDSPETVTAPSAIGRATRIVATADGLWVVDQPATVHRYDDDSLTRALTVDIPYANIVDIASDGRESVMVLFRSATGQWQAIRLARSGRLGTPIIFEGITDATSFVFLRRTKQFVVLAGKHQRLYWFSEKGGPALVSLSVGGMRPCFEAAVLGSDSRDRVFLAGVDDPRCGGEPYILIFDADGNALDQSPLDPGAGPVTGLAADRDGLVVTVSKGLLRFAAAEVVPEGAAPVRCTVMTPVLHSPDREDQRRWLRVEATADLPEGTSLEISFASTDNAEVRDRLNAILANAALPESHRVAQLQREPAVWRGRTAFHGGAETAQGNTTALSAKLFDVREPYLWVCVTLVAAPGARIPRLSSLTVLYPGQTLMANLPSIYQADEERPDSFLRGLVGVLEATTQGLDARIASMGGRIHPTTAEEPWLDFVARWLGVPWDDAMSVDQKRRLVQRASDLARTRGTRAGLEALLSALMPGTPKPFRVIDTTADFGFAVVGGNACAGSRLPAMLGGRTRWATELGADSVLGYMRLPCEGQFDNGTWQLAGHVRIDIAASAQHKKAWQPWMRAVVREMVPLTALLTLNWVGAHALATNRLDGTMTLEPPPTPRLGTDALTGVARLPERGARLSSSGPRLSTRLR